MVAPSQPNKYAVLLRYFHKVEVSPPKYFESAPLVQSAPRILCEILNRIQALALLNDIQLVFVFVHVIVCGVVDSGCLCYWDMCSLSLS